MCVYDAPDTVALYTRIQEFWMEGDALTMRHFQKLKTEVSVSIWKIIWKFCLTDRFSQHQVGTVALYLGCRDLVVNDFFNDER